MAWNRHQIRQVRLNLPRRRHPRSDNQRPHGIDHPKTVLGDERKVARALVFIHLCTVPGRVVQGAAPRHVRAAAARRRSGNVY